MGNLENILDTEKLPLIGKSKEDLRGGETGSVLEVQRMRRDV